MNIFIMEIACSQKTKCTKNQTRKIIIISSDDLQTWELAS